MPVMRMGTRWARASRIPGSHTSRRTKGPGPIRHRVPVSHRGEGYCVTLPVKSTSNIGEAFRRPSIRFPPILRPDQVCRAKCSPIRAGVVLIA